jgi:hypothetical protein
MAGLLVSILFKGKGNGFVKKVVCLPDDEIANFLKKNPNPFISKD